MKLLLFLFLNSFAALGQTERAAKFKVEFQEIKVAAQGGGWSDWKELGGINQAIEDETFTINYTNKTIVNDFKLKEAERGFRTYKIIGYSPDTSYEDFGFWANTLQVDEGKAGIKKYRLVYSSCDQRYTLICYSTKVQTRYLLKQL